MAKIEVKETNARFAVKRSPKGHVFDGVWRLMQDAYAVEARIIACDDFPPLSRSRDDIFSSGNDFYTAHDQRDLLVGVLELEQEASSATVASLCVAPTHFRQGIGKLLIRHVLRTTHTRVQVSTASLNVPAITLYLSAGFVKVGASRKSNIDLHHFEWRPPAV